MSVDAITANLMAKGVKPEAAFYIATQIQAAGGGINIGTDIGSASNSKFLGTDSGGNLSHPQTESYTLSNFTERRSLDGDTYTLAEVMDLLLTLIDDLKNGKIPS
jgi:hypothetical protein